MTSPRKRFTFASAIALFAIFAAPEAAPQTFAAPSLSASDFTFYLEAYDSGKKAWVRMDSVQERYFMNRARCECAGDTTDWSGHFKFVIVPAANTAQKIGALLMANGTGSQGDARLYVGVNGVNCLQAASVLQYGGNIANSCINLLSPTQYSAGIPGGMALFTTVRQWESDPIPVARLFNSVTVPICDGNPANCDYPINCATITGSQTIYFWAQTGKSTSPDVDSLSYGVNLVGQVDLQPTDVTVQGESEALRVDWGWPAGSNPATNASFRGVQILCQRGEDYQVFPSGTFAPGYTSSAMLCPAAAPTSPILSGFPISKVDPKYLCSGLLPATTTSYRISGLQNGVAYGVGVAAVDKYGNIGPITSTVYGTPVAGEAGFSSSGGCAIGGFREKPTSAMVVVGLGGLACIVVRRRRSRGSS